MKIPGSIDRTIRAEKEALEKAPKMDIWYKHKHSVNLGKGLTRLKKKFGRHDVSAAVEEAYGLNKRSSSRYEFVAREPQVALHRALELGTWNILKVSATVEVSEEERESSLETCKANKNMLGYATGGGARNGDANDWRTPAKYLDTARKVLGRIDLDPFSSEDANQQVGARRILTEHDNSLLVAWPKAKTAWMNPPYGKRLLAAACRKWVEEYGEGKFAEGIVLVNNATETAWLIALKDAASAIVFTDHRIAFESPDHKVVSGNTRGQCFFYFGERVDEFLTEFAAHGWGVRL